MTDNTLKYYIALQKKFLETKDGWRDGDMWKYPGTYDIYIYCGLVDKPPDCAIWLPRTIDDFNEETQRRSLWGMIDCTDKCLSTDSKTSRIDLFYGDESEIVKVFIASTSTEAILKALCSQEGIKEELCNIHL